MGHRIVWRCAMPVLHILRDPDDIALVHLLNGFPFTLDPAFAVGDDQRLTKRMGMPCRARTRFKGDSRAANARRGIGLERESRRTRPVK
jgi:hypothetical protein